MAEDRERRLIERILTLKHMLQARSDGPLEYHELGICYFMLKNFAQAAEYLETLQEKFPDYLELGSSIALRILCLVELGEYKKADLLLLERLLKYPHDNRLLNMRVFVLERMNQIDEAISTARRVLAVAPEDANAQNSLGYLLSRRASPGDLAEAGSFLKKAVSANPASAAYLDSLGVYLFKQKDHARARQALERALKADPENTTILDHFREINRPQQN